MEAYTNASHSHTASRSLYRLILPFCSIQPIVHSTTHPRPSVAFGDGQVGIDVIPFGAGEILRVRLSRAC